MKTLILASTSPYRRQLLESLMIPFVCRRPDCNEDHYKALEKDPLALAQLLARKKAESLAEPGPVVIGGDQLVRFKDQILGKGHDFQGAFEQLQKLQGQTHELITAVCVIARETEDQKTQRIEFVDTTRITLKPLSSEQIKMYLEKDQAWDCAGSYKIEKHGLSLIEKIETQDFTSIQGLPLLRLSQVLHNLGYEIPQAQI